MGLYTITCPSCKQPHMWFSGSQDQRCSECVKAYPIVEWTVKLNRYQRDNLLAALTLIMEGDLDYNTGDWVGELRYLLETGPEIKPNVSVEEFRKRKNEKG